MRLEDLPLFTVVELHKADRRGFVLLEGTFNHLRGVAETRGWLYRPKNAHIDGWLTSLDSAKRAGVFQTGRIYVNKLHVRPGDEFYWIDGYWDAKDVDRVLDTERWETLAFELTDSVAVYQQENGDVREKVVPGGWDHEHCALCLGHIEPGDAYHANETLLACVQCFERYVRQHDLSFMELFWSK